MQGVVRSFDPGTGEGVLVGTDGTRSEFLLATDALEGSIFRMLRQGQRVNFDLDGEAGPPGCASAPRSTWACPPTSRSRAHGQSMIPTPISSAPGARGA